MHLRSCYCRICTSTSTFTINLIKMTRLLSLGMRLMSARTGLLHGNNPSSSRREHTCCTTTSSSGHGTDRQTQPSLALALTSLLMAKLILVLWVIQSASTSGGQRCAGSTKFTLFETVTSLVPPTSHGAAHRWPPLVLAL